MLIMTIAITFNSTYIVLNMRRIHVEQTTHRFEQDMHHVEKDKYNHVEHENTMLNSHVVASYLVWSVRRRVGGWEGRQCGIKWCRGR